MFVALAYFLKMTFKDSDSLLFKEPRNDCQDAVVINFETDISR